MSQVLEPHKALLIGINHYPFFPSQNQLRGCRNDVELFGDLLVRGWGFAPESICRLLDESATADAIVAELGRLADGALAGSWVVFYYSGHGSRLKDLDAGGEDEDDGWDETLVPWDSGRRPYPNYDLTDDQIRAQLDRIRATGAAVLFVVDACRSGTVFRDDPLATLRQVAPEEEPLRPGLPAGPPPVRPAAQGSLLALTACEDSQGAYELEAGGQRHGAFTYHLVQSLERLGQEATWADLREHTLLRLLGGFSHQWPCFTGELGGKVPGRRPGYARPPAEDRPAKLRLRLDLGPAEADPVRAVLGGSPWVEEASPGAPAWASLGRQPANGPADAGACLSLQALTRAGGAVLLRAERLDPARVLATLESWAHFCYVRGLNGNSSAKAELLEIELLRRLPDRRWASAAESHQLPLFAAGDRLGLRIRSSAPEKVFLAVFLLAAGAEMKHLHPTSGPAAELPAGGRLEIGLGLAPRIVLKAADDAAAAGDLEQILVLASPEPWDWSSWLADLRSGPPSLPGPMAGKGAWLCRTSSYRLVAR